MQCSLFVCNRMHRRQHVVCCSSTSRPCTEVIGCMPLLDTYSCCYISAVYAEQGSLAVSDVWCMCCSHPEGATEAMQSSLTEPMLNTTGNASTTQRLLEGQTDATTTAKALIKPDAWVQAGKTLFQRATGRLKPPLLLSEAAMRLSFMGSGQNLSCVILLICWEAGRILVCFDSIPLGFSKTHNADFCSCSCFSCYPAWPATVCIVAAVACNRCSAPRQPGFAGNSEKLKILNMGQHILDSLDTPQQLYQVCHHLFLLFPCCAAKEKSVLL